jgi:hypothetical protein
MSQLSDEEFEQAKEQIAHLLDNDPKHAPELLARFSEAEIKRIDKAFERLEREEAEANSSFFRFLCGGLIGVDLLFLQGYLTTKLDPPETIALYAFAISLPFLTLCLVLSSMFTSEFFDFENETKVLFTHISLIFSIFLSYIGIMLSFFHFSLSIGTCFLFSSFIALLFLALIYLPVRKK